MTEKHAPSEDRSAPTFSDDSETEHIDISDQPYGVYQCRECDNVVLTMHDPGDSMTCHGEPMKAIRDWQIEVERPDLREVLLDAFGLPKPGIDICLCVIGDGPLPPDDVADRLGYDASTVRRYLNELVDMGLLTKSQLNRKDGGFVNVYHSIDLEKMRNETLIGFYVWAGEAATLIEEANLAKEEYLTEEHSEPLTDVFWEDFDGE
ncbi:MAG: putative transcriptional regulator [Haloarculaceae archaeon]|jgi:predicted transcriptional regulator